MPYPSIDATSRRAFREQVTLLGIGHLLAFVDRTKIVGLMPTIRHDIAMTDTAAGWVIGTAFALGYAACVLATLAIDRRRAGGGGSALRLAGGIALWGIASLATGFATSVATLIVLRALVGAGQALFIPAAVSKLVGEGSGSGAAGLSRFTAAASLGRSTGLLMVALVLAGVGAAGVAPSAAWRWVFALTALPNAMLLYRVARLPRSGRTAAPPALGSADPGTRLLYLAFILLPFILVQGLGGWLPALLGRGHGVGNEGGAAWAGVVALVGGASSQLIAGWLLHRAAGWQTRIPVLMVGALAATVPGMALVGWASGPVWATAGALWANMTLGAATFAALIGWQRLIPAAHRVAGNGVYLALVTVVGVGVGPLLTGIVADHGLALGGALLAMTAGLTVVAALLALVLQPLYRRHTDLPAA